MIGSLGKKMVAKSRTSRDRLFSGGNTFSWPHCSIGAEELCGRRPLQGIAWPAAQPWGGDGFNHRLRLKLTWQFLAKWNNISPSPRFPWNKGISLSQLPFGVRSCEVAIIWPDGNGKTTEGTTSSNFKLLVFPLLCYPSQSPSRQFV